MILLDLQMPVMGGLETITRIRELQRERGETPSMIVAFSAADDAMSRQQCSHAGFDDFLVKPASREELLDLLRAHAGAATPRMRVPDKEPDVVRIDDNVQALMPEFIASRREVLAQLRDAVDKGQRDAVLLTAHMLAGSFGMYGFRKASRMSREIEREAQLGELAGLRLRCESLIAQFEIDQAAISGVALS